MDIFPARVFRPGRHYDDKFHEEGRIVATFIPEGLSPAADRDKAFRCYVRAKPGSTKAEYLMGLKIRQVIYLVYVWRGDKSYFDIAVIHKSAASLSFMKKMKEKARSSGKTKPARQAITEEELNQYR